MHTGILHTHALATGVFLLLMLVFAFLLFAGKKNALTTLLGKTRIIRIAIGVLVLSSGLYLAFTSAYVQTPWFFVKTGLFLAAIPLAAVGLRKRSGGIVLISCLIFVYIYGSSEKRSLTFSDPSNSGSVSSFSGAVEYFSANCSNCHGSDGKAQLSGAKDLSISVMSDEEIRNIISSGKGTMREYKSVLNPGQISKMAEFVRSLRKSK